jgi:hypothetical protein
LMSEPRTVNIHSAANRGKRLSLIK